MVDPRAREQAMLERLRHVGLKLTLQRLAIVRELSGDTSHPTAQELFERLAPTMPTMSFATVYNTLGALVAAGLCAPKSFGPGAIRFDPNTEPHHHAICDRCGAVADLESTPVERIERETAHPDVADVGDSGFTVRAIERIYRGVCAACRSLAEPPSA